MPRSAVPSEDLGKPIEYDPNFNGPLKRRSCTDIICLLLFVAFIACWIFIGGYAFAKGDPETLLMPRDSNGARCGLDSHVRDKKYLLFYDLTKCLDSTVPFTGCKTTQVCVKECPKNNWKFANQPSDLDSVKQYCVEEPKNSAGLKKLIDEEKCPKWFLQSQQVFWRCLYNIQDRKRVKWDISAIRGDEVAVLEKALKEATTWISLIVHYIIGFFTDSDKAHQIGHDIVSDIKHAWKEIFGGIVIGMVICIIYIAMMRWIAGIMVWISIIGSIAILTFCVYFTAVKYKFYKANPTMYEDADNYLGSYLRRWETWLTLLIISAVVLGILLLILLFLRKRIHLAIALIKEGSKAVSAVTSSLFFPLIPWILHLAVIAYFIAVALYLSTLGNPIYKVKNFGTDCKCVDEANHYADGIQCMPEVFNKLCSQNGGTCKEASCHFVKMNNPSYVSYFHGINIFGFFWVLFFVTALGEMVLAATFATWYWTMPKSKVPFFTLTTAFLRTLRYHIGTLAFGSLIIAICRMIRVCLEYIDHKLKKYDNEITKAILCCMKCFFWCLEKFLKFINRNAYIMCAIHGKNFCGSAKDAFSLLLRNILRAFVLDKVTDFLFFLSKILLTLGVGCITYTLVEYASNEKFTYSFVPAIFVAVCIYLIACVFFNVYTMAVDTLFLCYLEDCERNDGSQQKPYFMSSSLMKVFGKKNK